VRDTVRYERNPDYIFRRIVDEVVLVPLRENVADMDSIYTMNEVAAFIWEKLEVPASAEELEAAVVAEYDVDPETARADLDEFLTALESAGAVRKV